MPKAERRGPTWKVHFQLVRLRLQLLLQFLYFSLFSGSGPSNSRPDSNFAPKGLQTRAKFPNGICFNSSLELPWFGDLIDIAATESKFSLFILPPTMSGPDGRYKLLEFGTHVCCCVQCTYIPGKCGMWMRAEDFE